MCNIAPAGVTPAATPVTAGGPTGTAPLSTDGVTPIPSILQPSPTDVGGVSGGGATGTPDLQTALQAVYGAIGSLQGALQSIQGGGAVGSAPVTGGGAGGCGCGQVTQGPEQLGGANAAPEPAKPDKPKEDPKPAPAAPAAGPSQAPAGFTITNPLPGAKVTSEFGEIAAVRNGRPHSGRDLAKPAGTPILAAAPGKITGVGFESGGLGNYVVIDHGNGWVTKYGHMVEKSPLKEGDTIAAGAQIGKVGSTGNSTGPHLHFMVVKDGKNQDPAPFLEGKKTF